LKEYKEDDLVTAITKYGAIADAYSELGQMDEAKKYYEKAVNQKPNEMLTPYYLKKLGLLYKSEGDQEKANVYFKRIRDDFPRSTFARDIEKYIFPPDLD